MALRVRKIFGTIVVIVGWLVALAGVWGLLVYVLGVFNVLGKPDESWFYTGLSFVLYGLGLLAVGVGAIYWGRWLRRPRD